MKKDVDIQCVSTLQMFGRGIWTATNHERGTASAFRQPVTVTMGVSVTVSVTLTMGVSVTVSVTLTMGVSVTVP